MAARDVMRWPGVVFDDPGGVEPAPVVLRTTSGDQVTLDRARWHQPPGPAEHDLLERAAGSVLDVGCGPGRHVLALIGAGRHALGIDTSAHAVATARRRGAPAVRASVYGSVPGAGSWGTVLLLDGNIGIGGNPFMLLSRVRQLVEPGGKVLVEVERPGVPGGRLTVRVEHSGRHGDWFAWARVPASQITLMAAATGFGLRELWAADGRWFAELGRRTAAPAARRDRPPRPGAGPTLRLVPRPQPARARVGPEEVSHGRPG